MKRVYKLHATLIKKPHSLRSFILTCAESSNTAHYAATVLLCFPIQKPDTFSFNTIIRKLSPHSPTIALSLFSHMHRNAVPFDDFTFPLILKHHYPNHLHSLILKLGFDSNTIVQNTLINAYGSRGSLHSAVKLFDEMLHRDLVSWSTLISCFVNNNRPAEAISFFQQMQLCHPDIANSVDGVIMLSVISAVLSLGVLELGIWVHCFIARIGLSVTVPLGTALVNMYSRCGSIDRSVKVFDEMPRRNVVTWTALINGLAVHGYSREALNAFYDMKESGLKPDGDSFIGALVACSHGGLVEDGWRIFESMNNVFGIEPMLEHYGCMVGLLGRAGLLLEAFKFVEEMPLKPNYGIWRTLIGACVNHNNILLAEKARKRFNELDRHHDGDYVLLSNAYGRVGNWGGKAGLRNSMRENKIIKEPDLSFIHIDQMVHEFVSGDDSHPQWEEITKFLVSVIDTIKLGGYTPKTSYLLHGTQEEEKEHCVRYHSEKLAVAFVLLFHRDLRTIRVTKNLRICYDCHDFMKHVSGIFNRDIIIRDRNRFHHFSKGLCSCQDFW